MDLETFGTVLGLAIEDNQSWSEALKYFTQLLVEVRTSENHTLKPPRTADTEQLISITLPTIVRKVLALVVQHASSENVVSTFLEESLALMAIWTNDFLSPQFLPVIGEMFDPAQQFYVHCGRANDMPYSAHIVALAREFAQRKMGPALMRIMGCPETSDSDVVWVLDILQRVANVSDPVQVLGDTEVASSAFVAVIQKFANVDDVRKIKFKELLKIVPSIGALLRTPDVVNAVKEAMMTFLLEVDIADVKIAGQRLCYILFTNFLTRVDEDDLTTLSCAIAQANSVESLNILKPVLVKLGERNQMTPEIMECLWTSVNSQFSTILQKCLTIFCDVALSCKNLPEILNIVKDPVHVEVYGQLIKGKQFEADATQALLDMGTPEAFRELTKAAKTSDISAVVPRVLEKLEKTASVTESAVCLLAAIFAKAPRDFDTTSILQSVAANFETIGNRGVVFEAIAALLRATSTYMSRNVFEKLYLESGDARTAFISSMVPGGRKPYINESSLDFLAEVIEKEEITKTWLAIVEHLYLHLSSEYVVLRNAINEALWKVVLSPPSQDFRCDGASLLLTFEEHEVIPTLLCQYVRRCLDELLTSENRNAAVFLNQCLSKASEYIDLNKLSLQRHKIDFPDDCIDVKVEFEGQVYPISVDGTGCVSHLITYIATVINRDPCSIILYCNKTALRPLMKIYGHIKPGDSLEVRCRREYSSAPPFTAQLHPAVVCIDEKYVARLFKLLNSDIGDVIYEILLQVPTPSSFSLSDVSMLDPSHRFLFMYQLHYLAREIHNMDNRKQVQANMEKILVGKFDAIEAEARFLLVHMLDPDSKNPELLTVVMCGLCKDSKEKYFTRIARRLWSIVGSYDVVLSASDLKLLLSNPRPKFRELALQSKVIQSQPFDTIWDVYCSLGDKLVNIDVISNITIPKERYQLVFESLVPYFSSLNEKLLTVFENITTNWEDFPFEQIVPILIDSYIKCTSKPASVTDAPFKLLISIMERNEDIRTEVLKTISETVPDTQNWNYVPGDSFKQIRCGLTNLGATCYINSVSQQLFNIPQIQDFFVTTDFKYPPIQAFHQLFTQLKYSARKAIDMHKFGNEWTGWGEEKLDPRAQQDAIEFLTLLLTRIEAFPPVHDLVVGQTVTERIGSDGKYKSDQETETFTALPLVVMDQHCIADSLKVMSVPEIISDYKPDGYDHGINLECTTKITKLPPYLIVQLKRFDYSIETGMKIKLDQEYHFEESFDFKPYFYGPEQETRYNLSGVVVHQGDAEAGHYLSYIKAGDDRWLCLNDQSVKYVSTSAMRHDADGSPEGSTAYLLFYERLDARDINLDIPRVEDEELVNSIKLDNLRLVIDSVYFSKPFAEFIVNVAKKFEGSETPMVYFLRALSHSSLVDCFNDMCSVMEAPERITQFGNYLQEHSEIILEIMTKCTNKEIRVAFSELVKKLFMQLPPENDLIIVIVSQSFDWFPQILDNWRNSFDIFKIFYDFASIGREQAEILISVDFPTCILNFLKDNVSQYVSNKDNKVTAERFCRLCDMTYLMKCFIILNADANVILSKQCMKWLVGSESHAHVLIEMILHFKPGAIANIDKIIDQTETAPSEFMVAELIKFDRFTCPQAWLSKYFTDTPKQKHLLRAVFDVLQKEPSLFPMFVQRQRKILLHLMFSNSIDVRNDVVGEIQRITSKVPDIDTVLFPLISQVPALSKTLYTNANYKVNIIPLDYFRALPFLQYLVEFSVKCPHLQDYRNGICAALKEILSIGAKRDEHAVVLAQLMCQIMKTTELAKEAVVPVQQAITSMYPDHKQLDSTLRNYFIGLKNQTKATADILIPDSSFTEIMFHIFLTSEATMSTSKREAMDLFTTIGARYAVATRVLKMLPTALAKVHCSDIKRVVQIISKYDKGAITQNSGVLGHQQDVLNQFLNSAQSLRVTDDNYTGILRFLAEIVQANLDTLSFVLNNNPRLIQPFVNLSCDTKISDEGRLYAIQLLEPCVKCSINDDVLRAFYGDKLVCSAARIDQADAYASKLISRVANNTATPFVEQKAAAEMVATINRATEWDQLKTIERSLNDLSSTQCDIKAFLAIACDREPLLKLLTMRPSSDVFTGYKYLLSCAPRPVLAELAASKECQPSPLRDFLEMILT